jgi:hypothetical protein
MQPLRAHVKNGRLVLDEPTELPEGEVVYLQLVDGIVADDRDDLDEVERVPCIKSLMPPSPRPTRGKRRTSPRCSQSFDSACELPHLEAGSPPDRKGPGMVVREPSCCSCAVLALVVVSTGCASHYAYRFQLSDPGARLASAPGRGDVLEDPDVTAEVQMAEGAVVLSLTNKSGDVIEVDWKKIVLDRGDGTSSKPRPEVDLGWIQPGAQVTARLVPFVVPRSGDHAAAYAERRLELDMPLVVHNEPKTLKLHFIAHVQPL